MIKLTIDGQSVEVEEGASVLDAASKLGIEIPTLCYRKDLPPNTSCMVCVVQVEGMPRMVPSCSMPAAEGMVVDTCSDAVLEARRTNLELLLSDHVGDCEAPCRVVCPASMDIPEMLRKIQDGDWDSACYTARESLVLPGTLGYICPAPCQKACRRARHDQTLAIRNLHRAAAERCSSVRLPEKAGGSGKKVAVIGAGPSGLSAAFSLSLAGHKCTVFDLNEKAGGMIRYADEELLPVNVLDADLDALSELGINYRFSEKIDAESFSKLVGKFDAVFLGTGSEEDISGFGLEMSKTGVKIDRGTFQTSREAVFAAGGVVKPIKKAAVKAVGDSAKAAASIDAYLTGGNPGLPTEEINVRMGKLEEDEMGLFLRDVNESPAEIPGDADEIPEDAVCSAEAKRCLHCDCRAARDCRLREISTSLNASTSRYKVERKKFEQDITHPEIVFEVGKCIDCGLCIQIARRESEKYGNTFIGRGFSVKVGPPFGKEMAEALGSSAKECVETCPTGALSFKDE